MPSMSRKVFFADHVFNVTENVYKPAEDSFLFAENLRVRKGDKVLDMGTGCGILGITAAVMAAEVVGVDVNPYAVHCAKENAKLNHVAERMSFVQGDLFGPVTDKEGFDLILFNAPYLPSEAVEADSWLERAWVGGGSGRKIVDDFIHQAPKHLSRNGKILLMQSTLSNVNETLHVLEAKGLRARVITRQNLEFFETIVLIEAKSVKRK